MRLWYDSVYDGSDRSELPAFHAVLTRYNMEFGRGRAKRRWANAERRRWLEHRLHLFTTFCLPSMLRQRRRPDVWLLGFDGQSPEAVEPVLDLVKDHPWIVPVWQRRIGGVYEDSTAVFAREIAARLPAGSTHVITTRIDNDDAINRDFLLFLRRYAAAVHRCEPDADDFWLVFPVGAFYHEGKCISYVFPSNPFCSRAQRTEKLLEDPSAVFAYQHAHLFANGCRVYSPMTTDPMWIRNYHGENLVEVKLANLRRFNTSSTRAILKQCGTKMEREPEHAWSNLLSFSREGRRSRRYLAKRLLRSAGLMKGKPAPDPEPRGPAA